MGMMDRMTDHPIGYYTACQIIVVFVLLIIAVHKLCPRHLSRTHTSAVRAYWTARRFAIFKLDTTIASRPDKVQPSQDYVRVLVCAVLQRACPRHPSSKLLETSPNISRVVPDTIGQLENRQEKSDFSSTSRYWQCAHWVGFLFHSERRKIEIFREFFYRNRKVVTGLIVLGDCLMMCQ